jgi:hypothetical protein
MNLQDYLGERNIEELIVKQFNNSSDIRLFSRDEAVEFVAQAFDYIEEHGLTEQFIQLDKRTICQLVYRLAIKPAEEFLWSVQIDLGLAGKVDTPDGPLYFFTRKAEDVGERQANFLLSVELGKRRGTSPLW